MNSQLDFNLTGKKIFVCGHNGLVGSAVVRRLAQEDCEILTADRVDLNLTDKRLVNDWFFANKPDAVIMAAAKVGGIAANNSNPVPFLMENLEIQNSIISSSFAHNVSKVLFLGSNCIYPVGAPQPIVEQSLLHGTPEPTNQWYAIAKIAGVKMCQAFRAQYGSNFVCVMPTNLYGPNDNFNPLDSHVIAGLISRFNQAKEKNLDQLMLWGSGKPLREFLFIDDLADALLHVLANYNDAEPINIGSGEEVSIRRLAEMLRDVIGWDGNLVFDTSKPDGAMRKMLCNKKITKLGWRPKINLDEGLKRTVSWYNENSGSLRL